MFNSLFDRMRKVSEDGMGMFNQDHLEDKPEGGHGNPQKEGEAAGRDENARPDLESNILALLGNGPKSFDEIMSGLQESDIAGKQPGDVENELSMALNNLIIDLSIELNVVAGDDGYEISFMA